MITISHKVLVEGGKLFNFDATELRRLRADGAGAPDGVVYEYQRGDDSYIVKFVPCEFERFPIFLDKVSFVDYLRDNDVSTPRLFPSVNGNLAELIEVDGCVVALTKAEKVQGRPPDESYFAENGDVFARQLGRVIGRMHVLSRVYKGSEHIESWREEHEFFAEKNRHDPAVHKTWMQLYSVLDKLPESRDAFGLVHNDPHPHNFLIDDHNITMIDFDVCIHHWFTMDIAIALYHVPKCWLDNAHKVTPRIYDCFMDGYAQENTLDAFWLGKLSLFMRYRRTLLWTVFTMEGVGDRYSAPLNELHHDIVSDAPVRACESMTWE